MMTLEEQLHNAGLTVFGCCEPLTRYGAEFLQTSPLLEDLTPAEADILGASMLLIRAQPGQVMIQEGEAGDWMMLVLKGTVDITKQLTTRSDMAIANAVTPAKASNPANPINPANSTNVSRVAVVRRGAAIGEMSMLDREPRYASCTAIDAVEAGVLGQQAIAVLIRDHPAVGAKLLVKITQLMAQRLRNTSNRLVKLLRQKP